jgi:uncharacterized protein (TIGR02118 family)
MRKAKFLFFFLTIIGLISFRFITNGPDIEAGLFKVAIMYPGGKDKTFDMEYYEKSHMPMMATLLGKNLKFYEIDKGISGRTPNDEPPFVAVGYFYCHDVTEYNQSIAKNIDTILNDIKKYTNIQPVILISEIKQVR